MKRLIVALLALLMALTVFPQTREKDERPVRLPDGRLQADAILKDAHEKSLEDATELLRLADELKKELERNEERVLSIDSIRTAAKIEDLAKRIKKRLKRF
ncbi:MAG: hypothetical protein KIT09_31040 [Bryobacteraceae bacterium]|nr:hypothetical protein [Bryobacteraceae bacterium]